MKTARHHLLGGLAALLTACMLVSCGSNSSKSPSAISALQSGHWTQVKKNPPTWFPKGIPADHPTNYDDGYWVSSGDAQGTSFFIPLHGTELPQQELIAEAQATMTPEARKELKRRQGASGSSDVGGAIVGHTAAAVLAIADAVSQMPAPTPPKKKKK